MSKASKAKEQVLTIRIINPKETIYQGKAVAVSSKNSAGNFDILPFHANFITVVEKTPIIIRQMDKKVVSFTFPIAILYLKDNHIDVYTEMQLIEEALNQPKKAKP